MASPAKFSAKLLFNIIMYGTSISIDIYISQTSQYMQLYVSIICPLQMNLSRLCSAAA